MTRFIPALMWILIPALLILGHDIYLLSQEYDLSNIVALIQSKEITFDSAISDLGYVWTQYHMESFKQVSLALSDSQREILTMLLRQKALFVIPGFFAVLVFLIGIIKFLLSKRNALLVGTSGQGHINDVMGRNAKPYKYSRK